MINKEFWSCNGLLWRAVRQFVEAHKTTCGLSDVNQNELIKDFVELIESQRADITQEVKREWARNRLIQKLESGVNEYGKQLVATLPFKKIDDLTDAWNDLILQVLDDGGYEDLTTDLLSDLLKEESWYTDFDEYEEKVVLLYFAYLQDWFSNHDEGDPVSIKEFLNNEMQDGDLAMFYKGLAEKKK